MTNTLLLLAFLKKRQIINSTKRKKRHLRVHPILQGRSTGGTRILIEELRLDSARFVNYFRMSSECFDKLLNKVGPHIVKIDTFREDVIGPSQRLALTLRFLASGDSMTSLYYSYRISLISTSNIIRETTRVIWDVLAPDVFVKQIEEDWKKVAKGFEEKWNFPHCIGAIDGQHVVIQAPQNSGSLEKFE
nr:uncharacterized protein LOC111421545 isoform X2 [Onthophagus taurus]